MLRKLLILLFLVMLSALSLPAPDVSLLIAPKIRFFKSNGQPCAGCKVHFFLAGTTTPAATYTDSTGTVQNGNPVILDAEAYGDIWLDRTLSYKVRLDDASDVTQWVVDGVSWTQTVFTSRTLTAGNGLSGGGDLTANRTFDVEVTTPITISADTVACPTCEVTGNKDAVSGYAGLSASSKLTASQGQEVWAAADLTDYTAKIGTGTRAIGVTITSSPAITITTSSVANPTVITTSAAHGLTTGNQVEISGHTGSTPAVDGVYIITVTGGSTFTIPVNVTVGGTGGSVLIPSTNQVLKWDGSKWVNSSVTAYAYNGTLNRWELFDSEIPTWLLDANPGWKFDVAFGNAARVTANDLLLGPSALDTAAVTTHNFATGRYRISTSAVASNIARINAKAAQDAITYGNLQSWLIVLDPTATNANIEHRLGFTGDTADPPTQGIYLERLGADTNWFLVTCTTPCAGGTQTRTSTGIAHAAGKIAFVIVRESDSSVKVYQPGSNTAIATSTTNIPADAQRCAPFFSVKTLNATARSLDLYKFLAVGIQEGY